MILLESNLRIKFDSHKIILEDESKALILEMKVRPQFSAF